MKAISLIEPWASLVAWQFKRIETRSWSTPYRGLVAIHASKSKEAIREFGYVSSLFNESGATMPGTWPITESYPLGCIVALARIAGCFKMTAENIGQQSRQERAFGAWAPDRFAWELEDVVRLSRPIPCRGALGLWNVPAEIEAEAVRLAA